jgi:hypothetical protein
MISITLIFYPFGESGKSFFAAQPAPFLILSSNKLWPPQVPLERDTAAGIKAYPLVFETEPLLHVRVAAAGAGTDATLGIDDPVPGDG